MLSVRIFFGAPDIYRCFAERQLSTELKIHQLACKCIRRKAQKGFLVAAEHVVFDISSANTSPRHIRTIK